MIREAVATGSTVETAREAAIKELGEVDDNIDIQVEIIDLPQKKTFGIFGGCPAKVRAYIELPDVKETIKTVEKYQRHDNNLSQKQADKSEKSNEETATIVELAPFTDDSKKAVADKGVKYLENILKLMNVEAELKSGETESGAKIMLEGKNLGTIVGRRGETLDALQYLTVLAANHGIEGYYRITLDTGNYREKRQKTLQALSRRMANQALKNGRNVTLEPMNPFERRIIHTAVHDIRGVTSWSVGEEPFRRVVIGCGKDKNYRRGRNNDRRSQEPKPNIPEREQKTDLGTAPLYGKIER